MKNIFYSFVMSLFLIQGLFAQENRIDIIRPDAPELAQFGPYTVSTKSAINKHAERTTTSL